MSPIPGERRSPSLSRTPEPRARDSGWAATLSTSRPRPWVTDVAIAAIVFVLTSVLPHPDSGPGRHAPAAATAVVAATALVLLVRRRHPLTATAVTVAGVVVALVLADGAPVYTLAVAIAMYALADRTSRRSTVIAFSMAAAALGAAACAYPSSRSFADVVGVIAWIAVPAALGDAVRTGRAHVVALHDRAAHAELTREEEARRRVAEERLRIARELHDVVAHHVAVVSVQAGVARHRMLGDPAASSVALRHVQEASSLILDELTSILRVLRDDEDSDPDTDPVHGLDDLDSLIASYEHVGLQIEWSSTGQPRRLGGAVDLVAYRVVQEALTNAHKHGIGTARVTVSHRPASVVVEIVNPTSRRDEHEVRRGYGLMGMHERAAAIGGVLEAGWTADGVFRICLTIPC